MNTLAMVLAIFIVAIIVLSKIPGLEHFVRPVIGLLFTAIELVFANAFAWLVWGIKLLMSAHEDLFRNLIFSAETIDPTLEMKNKS